VAFGGEPVNVTGSGDNGAGSDESYPADLCEYLASFGEDSFDLSFELTDLVASSQRVDGIETDHPHQCTPIRVTRARIAVGGERFENGLGAEPPHRAFHVRVEFPQPSPDPVQRSHLGVDQRFSLSYQDSKRFSHWEMRHHRQRFTQGGSPNSSGVATVSLREPATGPEPASEPSRDFPHLATVSEEPVS
jgi:hypothetical protein